MEVTKLDAAMSIYFQKDTKIQGLITVYVDDTLAAGSEHSKKQ